MARGVKMEMIAVVAIGIGAQDGAKGPTGVAPHFPQGAAGAALLPPFQDRDHIAIGQPKARDINGFAAPVFRDFGARAVVAGAAAVVCCDAQFDHLFFAATKGFDHIAVDPCVQGLGRFAVHDRRLAELDPRNRGHTYPVRQAAALELGRDIRRRRALDLAIATDIAAIAFLVFAQTKQNRRDSRAIGNWGKAVRTEAAAS